MLISRTCPVTVRRVYEREEEQRRKQYQRHFGKHTSKNVPRKVVSKPRFASVDEATLTWLKQLNSNVMQVTRVSQRDGSFECS